MISQKEHVEEMRGGSVTIYGLSSGRGDLTGGLRPKRIESSGRRAKATRGLRPNRIESSGRVWC